MNKKVLVTGILGQDGANMCEYLLKEIGDVKVFGMIRRSSNPNFSNCSEFIDHPDFQLDLLVHVLYSECLYVPNLYLILVHNKILQDQDAFLALNQY